MHFALAGNGAGQCGSRPSGTPTYGRSPPVGRHRPSLSRVSCWGMDRQSTIQPAPAAHTLRAVISQTGRAQQEKVEPPDQRHHDDEQSHFGLGEDGSSIACLVSRNVVVRARCEGGKTVRVGWGEHRARSDESPCQALEGCEGLADPGRPHLNRRRAPEDAVAGCGKQREVLPFRLCEGDTHGFPRRRASSSGSSSMTSGSSVILWPVLRSRGADPGNSLCT